jgi:branched-chain amino acid aminotransferase
MQPFIPKQVPMVALPKSPTLTWTYVDGDWYEGNVPLAGSNTHSLWLGSSVFDGARWFEGVAPDLDLHYQRLNKSARAMGLNALKSVQEIVDLTWEGLKHFNGETAVYIRPMYWAESGDHSAIAPNPDTTRFALVLYEAPIAAAGGAGISLGVSRFRKPSPEIMPTDAKAGFLYPANARCIADARSRGFDNALVLDMLGNVAETGSSNVFMVKDGVAYTPVLNGTFLAGITRARIIKLLRQTGMEVVEKTLSVADFLEADEVFTTGNYSKVAPVSRVEDRQLQPGPVAAKARQLYWDWALSPAD